MRGTKLIQEPVTREVIGAFYEVYNALGFGFLEHIYVKVLELELRARGLQVRREAGVCVMYKGEELAFQRLDLIVDEKVVVEVKSTYDLHPAAKRQLYNYLRATNLEVGLVLHFGPEPKFHRQVHSKSGGTRSDLAHSANPANPANPSPPFFVNASPTVTQPSPTPQAEPTEIARR